jgi:WS/DGAT/MGAT family acyltransferase
MTIDARLSVDPGGDLPFHQGLADNPTSPARRRGRASVDRASAADVMELVCDVSGTSMQVAVVLVLQGRVDLDAARQGFDDRIRAVPRLRQQLVKTPFGCGRQVWVDDPDFDIASHVRCVPCPAPGDERALLDVVAEVVTRRLPSAKPLWAATVITGLSGERTAVVVVFHHVLADGIGGLAILGRLADGAPAGAVPGFPRRPPQRRELLLDAIAYRGRAIGRLPAALGRFRSAATELGTRRGPTSAPRCSLNRPIGRRRALAVVRTDLAGIKLVAHSRGGTVNDVIIAAVTGALRAVLAERGENVDRLVVSMPVSARRQASVGQLGNQVGVIPVEVPTVGDPLQRLDAVAAITRSAKTVTPGASASVIGPAFRALAAIGVFGWFIAHQRLINTFVSNLRGPQQQLRFLGATVVDMMPASMITGNVTVAFTALSYAGTLVVTIVADPELCPETTALREALDREFAELTCGVGEDERVRPA